jgi:hypothetical protein
MNETDIEHLKTAILIAWRAREKGNHPFWVAAGGRK